MNIKENSSKLNMLKNVGFEKEVENVKKGKCPFCGKKVSSADLDDDLSRREFEISGMCQECQDRMFGT